jgi:hypothetical protein
MSRGRRSASIALPRAATIWSHRYFSAAAVDSMTPCDEATARAVVERYQPRPMTPYVPTLEAPRGIDGAGYVRTHGRFNNDFEATRDD